MSIKKLLQRIIFRLSNETTQEGETQQLKNKNNRLAKLLNVTRTIK